METMNAQTEAESAFSYPLIVPVQGQCRPSSLLIVLMPEYMKRFSPHVFLNLIPMSDGLAACRRLTFSSREGGGGHRLEVQHTVRKMPRLRRLRAGMPE